MGYLIFTFGVLNILVILDVANKIIGRIKNIENKIEVLEDEINMFKYERKYK